MAALRGVLAGALVGLATGAGGCLVWSADRATKVSAANPPAGKPGVFRSDLPFYTTADVAAHNGKASAADSPQRVWVVYRAGVYDVTEFVDAHPGGRARILLAAGSTIEPFWQQFTIHNQAEVGEILERHRIGNVAGYDAAAAAKAQQAAQEAADRAWDREPERHPALETRSSRPFNAETPAAAMTDAPHITNELFFVRNHMPVPDVTPEEDVFCVEIKGEGIRRRCHTLPALERDFASHTISSTLQCGGNRRKDAAATGHAVKGLGWTGGAIGNATWTGVWLREVLAEAMCDRGFRADPDSYHVRFQGMDTDGASNFEVSIPLSLAMDPRRDVLLATQMNGAPLPRDHGFPLRAIVPGVVGVRNCKWLKSIEVHREESQSDWQQRDYKNFPSWMEKPDASYESVYDTPVQSQITDVERDGAFARIKGYAYCGGGRGVQRVEVSADGGATFSTDATLDDCGVSQPRGKRWAWYQFTAELPLATEDESVRVCTRAVSGTNDIQPPVASRSFRGLLYNGYSCRDL